ncbi:hypothetical protein HanRHA438_Chr13g0587031 [Helianthus annuus]|nr:hypothetical protein HanLR1_Chr13g0474261 [Helianthus annuus]KAJ0848211.1 hypothetical protein HanPSC8_Chr13g0554501 [Helianthus annuus]KAJ0857178.1 hypothetical protein HanRHA438_Chr13g0587031 [Helianthus annuus]
MICKIENRNYVAPENDAWRHENNNSEDEADRLRDKHEKKLRYWFVKDGKRKRTPKPAKKKPTPTLVDETVLNPADVLQGGEAEAAKAAKVQGSNVEKVAESSKKYDTESVKEKDAEGVAHTDSSDADDESIDTESEIDTSKIGVGKVNLKKKPQKKKKDSDEEDEMYIPTPQAEKKKGVLKRKANPQGVIPRRVRARKGSASVPEIQSGKSEKHVVTSKVHEADKDQNVEVPEVQQVQSAPEVEVEKVDKPEVEKKGDDEDEAVITGERVSTPPPPPENPTIHITDNPKQSPPKKDTTPGLFEGFHNIHGEFKDDILPDEDYDMFHDAMIKDLTKKVSLLEKEKAKAEAERDELRKTLEKTVEVNEEMKSVVNDHAERIDALTEDLTDNAKLIDQLTNELSEVNARYKNMNETN